MLVTVGSKNSVKVDAVKEAFRIAKLDAEVFSIEVESGVPAQPFCDDTFTGARNRALRSMKIGHSDMGIGIEGGVCERNGRMVAFAVVHVVDKGGKENFSTSASFTLPENIAQLIREGKELGEATDVVFKVKNSKEKLGAVGHLSKGLISRTTLYIQPVLLAIYPFI
ncbi:Non-canonical purine NTP phosphatase [Sulfuracidifex tepidarius]|uniref:Probable inosine/xanthosine triphosphatase n=1 Tax=Sulfuracidifex tepidarius TaxID=1294262 RepID=A0A510DZN1_9CREN|nr:inosine/xanthosine triphosphatase [Sulfuracidifex tepidarius]BBG25328.1 Non-canonical purine NTP phosphatase [Sulfuracidifex tepidarius]